MEMQNSFLFDDSDRKIYKEYLTGKKKKNFNSEELLFNSHMHARGIKELLEPKQIRVAKSVLYLMHTMENESADDRLQALHSLRDEVLFCAESTMTRNTARVLLAIMKHLVSENDEERKMELLHDFHTVMSGKAIVVRKYLRAYGLLEMPEAWNQISFDYHVHDSYTKGLKSPTHLIMDAWIKGLRELTVIYYDFVPDEAVHELITAASYMQIDIHIGIEYSTWYRNGFINFIWVPDNLPDAESYLSLFNEPEVRKFFEKSKQTVKYKLCYLIRLLKEFNKNVLVEFNRQYGIQMEPLVKETLIEYIDTRVPSPMHLAEYIYHSAQYLIQKKNSEAKAEKGTVPLEKRETVPDYIQKKHHLSADSVYTDFLQPLESSFIDKEQILAELPEIMKMTPCDLIHRIKKINPESTITLSLLGLNGPDVLEQLYECGGTIDSIEIYNNKNYVRKQMTDIREIKELEQCINEKDSSRIKHLIKKSFLAEQDGKKESEQTRAVKNILLHIDNLFDYYRTHNIHETWGSDSAGRSGQSYGMGFALLETLPVQAQKEVLRHQKNRLLPVHIKTTYKETYRYDFSEKVSSGLSLKRRMHKLSGEWIAADISTPEDDGSGNLVMLDNRTAVTGPDTADTDGGSRKKKGALYYWTYLSTDMKNVLKIALGFIPAFLTFYLTKDWWVLAYLGAPIWFAITGVRNIIQAVLGGDSMHRSPLLHWTSYIDWSRIADSLLYSGISVPILDYLVKSVLLDRYFSINMKTNPVMVYTVMSLVNGVYMSAHNILRGLPRMAVIGNFFRSVISIPLAFFYNSLIGSILVSCSVSDIDDVLQKWAAVISKAASDFVGGFIEGIGDRQKNIRLRRQDYTRKLSQLKRTCSDIELLYPRKNIFKQLRQQYDIIPELKKDNPNLLNILIYDSLDLFYFWMYQPHARTVLKNMLNTMDYRERNAFLFFQYVLRDQRIISTLLVKGIVGMNFEKVLALYLSHYNEYLKAMEQLVETINRTFMRRKNARNI